MEKHPYPFTQEAGLNLWTLSTELIKGDITGATMKRRRAVIEALYYIIDGAPLANLLKLLQAMHDVELADPQEPES